VLISKICLSLKVAYSLVENIFYQPLRGQALKRQGLQPYLWGMYESSRVVRARSSCLECLSIILLLCDLVMI